MVTNLAMPIREVFMIHPCPAAQSLADYAAGRLNEELSQELDEHLHVCPTCQQTVVDLRVGGEVDGFFWAVAVQNLFDVKYFEYAIASTFTLGTYNAYPLPGRTFMVRAGKTFGG